MVSGEGRSGSIGIPDDEMKACCVDWEPYIRATALIGFRNLAESHGGDVAQLAARAGIPLSAFGDIDGLTSYRRLAFLLERRPGGATCPPIRRASATSARTT